MVKKIGVKISIISVIFLAILLINLLTVSIVSAETSVNVKGLIKGNDVTITVIDPSSEDTIVILNGTASTAGELTSSFSTSKSIVNLVVVSRSLGKISQGPKKFNDYSTLNSIILNMEEPKTVTTPPVNNTPAPVVNTTVVSTPPVNNTPSTTSPLTNLSTSASNKTKTNTSIGGFFTGITNFSSSVYSKIPWKIIFYIILGIIVIAVLVFIFIFAKDKFKDKYLHGSSSGFSPKVYFGSKSTPGLSSGEERALRAAEEKIKSAQEEINLIRHRKEKIKEAERRLEQDKRELEKLRGRF